MVFWFIIVDFPAQEPLICAERELLDLELEQPTGLDPSPCASASSRSILEAFAPTFCIQRSVLGSPWHSGLGSPWQLERSYHVRRPHPVFSFGLSRLRISCFCDRSDVVVVISSRG